MSKIKRLAGETVMYGLGSIVPRFINFGLVFLHTSVFNPVDYGIVTWLLSYTALVNTVYTFGMETAYFRFATKQGADENRIFNLTQTVVLLISGICSLLLFIFADQVSSALDVSSKPYLIRWLSVIMFIDAGVAIPFARLRLQKKALAFALGRFLNVVILVVLNVYFLVMAGSENVDVGFVFLANLIANAFYLVFFGKQLLRWRPVIDTVITREIFKYGYPVMLTGLAGMTNEMFSRMTLKAWLPDGFYHGQSSEYALGIFGACYKLSVIMNLAITAFRYAAEPFFFSNAIEKNSPQLFSRINHYFVIVCCVILLGVSVNLDLLQYFFRRPEYAEGIDIVPVLLLAYLFLGIYYNFSVWFKLTDRTYYGTIITLAGVAVTIAGNYYLIPIAGYMGSSWAALLCFSSMAVICYALGQKFYPIPYKIGSAVLYLISTIFLVYVVNAIEIENQWLASSFHGLVVILYVVIIFFLERKSFARTLG